MPEKILIIRLGALGDIFLCMKPFQDIRRQFPDAHITYLVTPPFAALARTMPWFDAVITDTRPPFYRIQDWLKLGGVLKEGAFTRVFDLQNKPRTNLYYKFFFDKHVGWSGTAKGCAYPRPAIEHKMHRQQEHLLQLRAAGVADSGPLDLTWMMTNVARFDLPSRYALFVPGCSPHLLHKRWPPESYADLAMRLREKGLSVLLSGTGADAESIGAIMEKAPFAVNLCGKTNLQELASIAQAATCVVGNDTGPTFLAAMMGAPTLTLMSHHTDPVLSGPLGPHCAYLKKDVIADLSVDEVMATMRRLSAV